MVGGGHVFFLDIDSTCGTCALRFCLGCKITLPLQSIGRLVCSFFFYHATRKFSLLPSQQCFCFVLLHISFRSRVHTMHTLCRFVDYDSLTKIHLCVDTNTFLCASNPSSPLEIHIHTYIYIYICVSLHSCERVYAHKEIDSNLRSSLLRCGTMPNEWGTQWDSNSLV